MSRTVWSKSSLECFLDLPVWSAVVAGFALSCSPAASGDTPTVAVSPTGDMGSAGTTGDVVAPTNPPSGMVGPGDGDVFIDPDEVPVSSGPPNVGPVRRRGLLAKQVTCPDGGNTTVSGTVYIPSGQLPLYNAMVYVPDAELRPLTPGVGCNCEVSGEPIASALTDASGHFVLSNVPVGSDIPIVVQVGDWRREFKLPSVTACADTAVPDQTLRLPARQSEGDIPRIAVVTAYYDALECLVRKLGVDESEFTNPSGTGRITLYAGENGTDRYSPELNEGRTFLPAPSLWGEKATLDPFDIVLMSCDGPDPERSEQSLQAMYDYLNQGGRVFGSHFQAVWFEQGPAPFPELAQYDSQRDLEEVTGEVIASFPKGAAMAEWLVNAGASDTAGQVQIQGAQHNIVVENPEYAQRWITTSEPEESVQYLSANTPLGASDAEQCGRLVLSDIHVSQGGEGEDASQEDLPFPQGCRSADLSPQEAALAFMLFDLSACIVPDDQAPVAAPIIR